MIDDPAYALLKDQLIATTGLAYYSDRDEDLAERIDRRLSELGLPHCGAYAALLADEKAGPGEMDAMIARLSIGETYFFRDEAQFDAIRNVVLPEIIDRNHTSKQLRIWSAGCANGAEPYSLAILLERELKEHLDGWQVSILATDIDRRSLAAAAEGKFGEWALRSTPDEVRQRNFSYHGQNWTINPELKQGISFLQMNLVETGPASPWNGIGSFDLILCRNVMIYFTAEAKRRLIKQFNECLVPGGWLLVGAVEHDLSNFTSFRSVSAPGVTLYQNPDQPEVPGQPREPERPLSLALEPAYREPTAPPMAARREAAPNRDRGCAADERPSVQKLRRFADRGDWKSAVPYCRQLLEQDGLNPTVHFYRALVLDQMGEPGEAERSLRQAIYLDRNFLLAHYHLGLVLTRERKPIQATRSFDNVLKLSCSIHDDQAVEDGDGLTVGRLKELAKMHIHNLGV